MAKLVFFNPGFSRTAKAGATERRTHRNYLTFNNIYLTALPAPFH